MHRTTYARCLTQSTLRHLFPSLCWRTCLGAERDFVVNATIPVPCARSSRAGRHEVNGGHLPARVGKPTRPATVPPPPFPALQPNRPCRILPEQSPLADVAPKHRCSPVTRLLSDD